MVAEGVSLDCQSQLRVTEQLLPPARRKECAWFGGRGKAMNLPALPHFWRVLCRRGLGSLYRGPLPWSVTVLDSGCVHDFFGSHWSLSKEDIQNSQKENNVWRLHFKPGITDSLPSELPYFGACPRPGKIKGILLVLVCFIHRRLGWLCQSLFLWFYQWEISINGLFVLHYLHKSNLFFTEFAFKGCIRCKISREWALKVIELRRIWDLSAGTLKIWEVGGVADRSEGKSKHLK